MNPSNQDQRGMPAGSGIQPLVFSGDETQVASRKRNTTWGLGILELSDSSKRECASVGQSYCVHPMTCNVSFLLLLSLASPAWFASTHGRASPQCKSHELPAKPQPVHLAAANCPWPLVAWIDRLCLFVRSCSFVQWMSRQSPALDWTMVSTPGRACSKCSFTFCRFSQADGGTTIETSWRSWRLFNLKKRKSPPNKQTNVNSSSPSVACQNWETTHLVQWPWETLPCLLLASNPSWNIRRGPAQICIRIHLSSHFNCRC